MILLNMDALMTLSPEVASLTLIPVDILAIRFAPLLIKTLSRGPLPATSLNVPRSHYHVRAGFPRMLKHFQ